MTETTHSAKQRIEQRRRYKRLMYGSLAAGIVALPVLSFLDQYLLGVLIYWAGFFGMLAIWKFSPVTLYDERDIAIERKASDYTMAVFAFVLVLGAPGGIGLERAEILALPEAFHGAMWALVTLYVAYAAIYTTLRYRA